MRHIRLRQTTKICMILGAVLLGLLAGRWVSVPYLAVIPVLCMAIVAGLKSPKHAYIIMIAAGLAAGMWRGSIYQSHLVPYTQLDTKTVTVQVIATTDAVYGDRGQLSFEADHVFVAHPIRASVPGVIRVAGYGAPMVYRGDSVTVHGKLFKTRGYKQAAISYAELKVYAAGNSWIDSIRRHFATGLSSTLPEPHASFALGLLIGQRSTLPDTLNKTLTDLGLAHIVAVSGYNLTIIVGAVKGMNRFGSKFQKNALAIALIVLFVLATGFSASIVRAAIVSMLSIMAGYYGRQFRPLVLIMLTAALTAAWNPLYIWSDIGWYLSFLSFFGVLVVAPLLVRRFYRHAPRVIGMVMIETMCALALTMPLSLYLFGKISLIALVSNMAIVPFIPLAMLLCFIAGLAGMIPMWWSSYFSLPGRFVMAYILDIMNLLIRIPHITLKRSISASIMACSYGLIIIVISMLWHKSRQKSGIITDRNQ